MIEALKKLFGIQPQINLGELVKGGAIILDVRSQGEFSGGHIKGSINIPVDQIVNNLQKLKNKNQPIITCCASGMRSATAKGILTSRGYSQVYNGGSWMRLDRKINS